LTKTSAEELLDWLEVRGLTGRVSWEEAGASFIVEYDALRR
jgi:hypothetical protein